MTYVSKDRRLPKERGELKQTVCHTGHPEERTKVLDRSCREYVHQTWFN